MPGRAETDWGEDEDTLEVDPLVFELQIAEGAMNEAGLMLQRAMQEGQKKEQDVNAILKRFCDGMNDNDK